ncbi:adenylyltransferase/cytidyltransferase family protein [Gammaproteobacteria bacterium]|nr:adenylyltransferase/cytidyltransferase family protein [Gammaproteobacteria bacterium]
MTEPDRKRNGSTIRVYSDMVADLFHYGHVEFLRQVSALGDYVMVGINSDDEAEANKRRPVQTMKERIESVATCRYVDEVIPNAPWVFDPAWIEEYDIDLVVHGDDYSDEQRRYFYKVPIELGIFRTVTYTKSISTTEIIRRCNESQLGKNAVGLS